MSTPLLTRIANKVRAVLTGSKNPEFDRNNPLGAGGERVDFIYDDNFNFEKLDVYQKSHYRRYEFALKQVKPGDACGDFACGSGYGSVMLSKIASSVVGIDLDKKVVLAIQERYKKHTNVEFRNLNLLDLDYENRFNVIVSFETIEHIDEPNIHKLLHLYNKAMKPNAKLIFSTPYMQPDSPDARKLGFHQTFYINEEKITQWLTGAGFGNPSFNYQDYKDHTIKSDKTNADFIICVADKVS
jgi:2-polyprenyl-3-methyl-5-hydroxy-6-metoxy-1,4-benzoquinol methylase